MNPLNQPLFVISNNGIELDQHIFSKIKAGGFCVRLSRKPGNNIYQLETQDQNFLSNGIIFPGTPVDVTAGIFGSILRKQN